MNLFGEDDSPGNETGISQDPLVEGGDGEIRTPRETSDLVGHGETEAALARMIREGKLPHAMIFSGPRGIGKSVMAFRLARSLFCSGESGDLKTGGQDSLYVPESVPAFARVRSGAHPNLLFVGRPFDDKKQKRSDILPVEEARKVAPFMRLTASDGGWRVAIIDDADTMNRNAQNAILKILEEPPEKTIIILVCQRLGAIIPTIVSRSRVFPFKNLTHEQIDHLTRTYLPHLSSEDRDLLSLLSEGSFGKLLELESEDGIEGLNLAGELLAGWPETDWNALHAKASQFSRAGQDAPLSHFLSALLWLFRYMALCKARGIPAAPVLTRKVPCLSGMMEILDLSACTALCDRLDAHIRGARLGNLDKRYIFMGCFTILQDYHATGSY